MSIKDDKFRKLVLSLAYILKGFGLEILNSYKYDYTIDDLKRVSTGYQPILGSRIHWGLMIDSNNLTYPLSMGSDDFVVVLDHYDGVMISKTKDEFTLSTNYTGWYIIIEKIIGVRR